eukprot:5500553-Amphidinium_carterae.1
MFAHDTCWASGLIQVAKMLQSSAAMKTFRGAVLSILEESVVRKVCGAPSEEADEWRALVFESCYLRGATRSMAIKLAVSKLLNGDFRTDTIEHYCTTRGCCGSQDDLLCKLRDIVVPALLGSAVMV